MKDELAERVLSRVMGWGTVEVQENIPDLQALAAASYDEYGNYGPGSKFVENFAAWLKQFPAADRPITMEFVQRGLVFVSEVRMTHLISLVGVEIFAPVWRVRIAEAHEFAPERVAAIERHPEFERLRRRSLIVGASDGARLDRLRRASRLSHEQFLQGPVPLIPQLERARGKLATVLEEEGHDPPSFGHIFFVDDFAGSGKSMVREENGGFDGKLVRLAGALEKAAVEGHVEEAVRGTVVLYCASAQAIEHIESKLETAGLGGWTVETVQKIERRFRVDRTFPAMAQLCERFYDPSSEDEYKGRAPLGYDECALPVVLSHNTPNNSVCLLWMDTRGKPGSNDLRALFPRYERHHPDRR